MIRNRFAVKVLVGVLVFILPTWLVRPFLNYVGHRVKAGSRIGFSWLWCDFVGLDYRARIGNLNFISIDRLVLREGAYFGRMNIVKGPLSVILSKRSALGNANRVLRAPAGVTHGAAQLWLGELAKITANHRVDCTATVRIGAFSTIAGAESQIWTHGYIHEMYGSGRYRIDGRVDIEDNVYIGSACLVSMGVRIAKGVIVGGGTTVSKNLLEPALYVSSVVRQLPRPLPANERQDLSPVIDERLVEPVFVKRPS